MTAKIKTLLVAAVFLTAAASAYFQQRQILHLRQQVDAVAAHSASAAKPTLNQLEASLQKILAEPNQMKRMTESDNFAQTLTPTEAKALLDYLDNLPANNLNRKMEESLIPVWAQDDPATALAWVQSHFEKPIMPYVYTNLLGAWMNKDPQGALAAVNEMVPDSSDVRSVILGGAIGLLAAKNPQQAFDLMGTLPSGEQDYDEIFYPWASMDPTAAASAALSLPPNGVRNHELRTIGMKWALLDGPAALVWADSLPPDNTRTGALNGVLSSLEDTDPQTAMSYLTSLPADAQRDTFMTNLLSDDSNMITTDPASLLAWVDNTATGQTTHDQAVTKILSQISGNGDPGDAAAYLAQNSDAAIRNAAIPDVAAGLAKQDPSAALAWVQSLPDSDGTTRQKALDSVVTAWAGIDPTAAITYIQQNIPDDPNAGKIITQATDNIAKSDPQAAIALAQSLPAGPAQDTALNAAISTYAEVDPQAAWDDAMQLPTGDNQVQTMGNVIAAWGNLDPATAITYLDNMPPGTPQDAATLKVTDNWFKHDPAAEVQWFNTLPAGSTRDHAVRGQVAYMAKTDLPGALALAASVGDATIRNRQIRVVIQQWAKVDPAAALNALQSVSLTPQQLSTLTTLIQNQAPGN